MYQYSSINSKGQVTRSDFTWGTKDWNFICKSINDFVYIQLNDRDGNIARQWARLNASATVELIKEN